MAAGTGPGSPHLPSSCHFEGQKGSKITSLEQTFFFFSFLKYVLSVLQEVKKSAHNKGGI